MSVQNKVLLLIVIVWFVQLFTPAFEPSLSSYSYGQFTPAEVFEEVTSTTTDSSLDNSPTYQSIVFVGDVLLARNVEKLMSINGEEYPFSGLAIKALATNPAVIGNFESGMATPHTMTEAYGMRFSVDDKYLPALKAAQFTHLSLANNHSLDFGEEGYQKTKASLTQAGLTTFGHQNTLTADSISYLETPYGVIALVGIHAVTKAPLEAEIKAVLQEASTHSEWQIAYVHWGDEYVSIHNEAQSKLATKLVENGIDLIIGHHPHVVQDIQIIDGVVVVYSLGNYIFDQYFSNEVQIGLVTSLHFLNQPTLNLIPVTSVDAWSQPKLMSPKSHQNFLETLATLSDPSLAEYIKAGYLPLHNFVATSSKTAIMVP